MAALRYHPHRSAAELELDGVYAAAERRCQVMQARLDDLESDIVATRRLATAAGVFNHRTPLLATTAPNRPPVQRALRLAFARAVLRNL